MNLNKNDYIIVNGKRYYADGGDINSVESGGIVETDPRNLKNWINNYYSTNNVPQTDKKMPVSWGKRTGYKHSKQAKSGQSGMNLYNSYSPEARKAIAENRKLWYDRVKDYKGGTKFTTDDGFEVDLDKYLASKNYDDEQSRHVNGIMHELYPNMIIGNDNGDNYSIPSGDNIFYSLLTTQENKNASKYVPDEWKFLNSKGLASYRNGNNKHWTRYYDEGTNSIMYNFYDTDDDGNVLKTRTLSYDPSDNGGWYQYSYDKNELDPNHKSYVRRLNDSTNDILSDRFLNDYTYENKRPIWMGNDKGLSFNESLATNNGWIPYQKAYGGPTTRLFAEGGEMIPMGEQPDYNMVGAGGSHEMNPQGGVPYGMNQDGSQNMVEQGEVSVGNNVFSDRTAISPELCQQLGLPEGTSHAQAMQQIEALYEQGQIGDQEYQEISQILFQDQEAQKQGGGMPQPQNEGIQPEMVAPEGYAWGGRRRCR